MNNLRLYEACVNKIKNCVFSKRNQYCAVAISVLLMVNGCAIAGGKLEAEVETAETDYIASISLIDNKVETIKEVPEPKPTPIRELKINLEPTVSPNPVPIPITPPPTVSPNPVSTSTVAVRTVPPVIQLDAELQAIIGKSVRFSNSSYTQIKNYINSIIVNYQYSELFNIKAALAQYNGINRYRANSSAFVSNNRIDKVKIRNQIISNNADFLSDYSARRLSELSSSDFDKVFATFIETLEYNLSSGYVDLAKLDEKIQNLKILSTTDSKTAYVDAGKGILAVNMSVIGSRQTRYPSIDYLRKIIVHETIHFIQMPTQNETEHEGYKARFGISYDWEEHLVDSLFNTWFHEGSADRIMAAMDNYDMTGATYPEYVKSVDSLTLATMLRNDVNERTISQISLQNDLNKLFVVFGCQTDQEKREILEMMFSFDITHTDNKGFYDAYKEFSGSKMESSGKREFGYAQKASQAQTLTKIFYSNLANSLTSSNVKIEDIFKLISIFEADMSRLTWYASRPEPNRDFFNTYVGIQNQFFARIAAEVGVGAADITRAYNAYNSASSLGEVSLSFFNSSENNYLTEMSIRLNDNKRRAINEIAGETVEIVRTR